MKNEVINSFAEGLVSDLNELNTPNKVMTDALNATLITFNGNEFSLQNDMGNAKVGTAYLPQGYVPVGMKEHGGIIYVASHNPETGRGQIGCFPSPQELWSDEDGEIAEIEINFTKLLGFEGNLKYLQVNNEFYRENIFLDKATKEPRIFHPGDKFIITCNSLDNIAELLSEGILTLKLASVGTDGVLNYIDNSKLNIYKNGTFIYTGSEDVKDLLKNNEYVQVFPGTSSGKLMLIVEYNVYDTFDLSWSFDNTTGLKAIFKGSTTGNLDYAGLYNLNNGEVSTNTEPVINITPNNNIINYNIAPYSNYGIVKRLIRSGSINVSNLTEEGKIDQWSYFVGNDYIDITWSFQYLDLNGKEAQSMRFVFIPLEAITDEDCKVKSDIEDSSGKGWYNIELEKASYNGNFDEHILFIDGKFERNKKYVCRIDKKINDIWSAVGYEYVYTSTFFNNISAEQIKSYKTKRPVVTLIPEFNIKESTTETVSYYKTKNTTGNILEYQDVTYLDSLTTINPTSDIYRFRSGIHKKYNTKLNIEYIGINADLQNKLAAESLIPTYNIDFDGINSTLNTELNYSSTLKDNPLISELANLRESSSYKDSLKIKKDDISSEEINLEFDIYRDIYAKGSAIKTKVFNDVEYLSPLSETLLSNYKGKNLSCIGMNDSRTITGILISNNTEHNSYDEGVEVSNSSATQATLKEAVTSSGDNIINFVTGIGSKNVNPNYDEASLLFFSKKLYKKWVADHPVFNLDPNWPSQDQAKTIAINTIQENREYTLEGSYPEIDAADNFLIPSWKADNGEHYLLNLITKKNEEIYSGKKRVDTVLRCILSQLLVVQKGKRELNYLTPDSENFIYHVNSPTNININIPITCTFTDDEEIYTKWENATQVQNYLPEIKVQNKELSYNITKEETVESTNLIALYLDNSGSSLSLTAPHPDLNNTTDEEFKRTWRKYIYLGEVNSISPDGTCNITTDDYGVIQLYKNSNHGIASNVIYNWHSNKEGSLKEGMLNTCDINKTFITSTAIDGTWGSEITEETKVYLNSDNITDNNIALGYWLYGGDHNSRGPVLASGTYFGSKSMFKESF